MKISEQKYLKLFNEISKVYLYWPFGDFALEKNPDKKAKIALCGLFQKFNIESPTKEEKAKKDAIESIIVRYTSFKVEKPKQDTFTDKYEHTIDFSFDKTLSNALEIKKIKKILIDSFEKEYADELMEFRQSWIRHDIKLSKQADRVLKTETNETTHNK